MNDLQQPEPCLGGIGTHDRDGRCYLRIACSVFGFCRERAVQNRELLRNGEPPPELRERWKAEAKQRAEAEQQAYLQKIDEQTRKPVDMSVVVGGPPRPFSSSLSVERQEKS